MDQIFNTRGIRKEDRRNNTCIALEHVWSYLKNHLLLANTHGAEFISERHWETFVPERPREQLLSMTNKELVNLSQYGLDTSTPVGARNCHLDNIATISTVVEACGDGLNSVEEDSEIISDAMSQKKNHEIRALSEAVMAIYRSCRADVVVDIGSGKGYLGYELSRHHNIPVLGLDSCHTNTHGAVKRDGKLARRWKALTRKKERKYHDTSTAGTRKYISDNLSESSMQLDRHHKGDDESEAGTYVPVTLTVDPDMNLHKILQDYASHLGLENPLCSDILLTGLHTCGSLSVTLMKLFIKHPRVVGTCFVGCCYQLMEELPHVVNEMSTPPLLTHFPLSKFGQKLNMHLGRNARNLAAQSVARIQTTGQLQGAVFCWRAMLDVLLREMGVLVPERILGMRGLHKKSSSFLEYVQSAVAKLELNPQMISLKLVSSLEEKYEDIEQKMTAFFQLKLVLAPVIESLILLDRCLYLLEQDSVLDVHLVRLFDPITSPRCYGIIAIKEKLVAES